MPRQHIDLTEQPANARDMRVETAIDAGTMHAILKAMRTERDAWQQEAKRATLSVGADHDREPSRDLIALPAPEALGNSQNLFRPVSL